MSKFAEFYNKIMTEPEIAADFKKVVEVQKIPLGTSFSNFNDENLAALLPIAKKAGFEFTLDEVKTYFAKADNGELSEDELEAVAGGKDDIYCDGVGAAHYH